MLCVSQLELKYPVVCFRSLNILTAYDCSQKFKYWTRNYHKSESFEDILLDKYIHMLRITLTDWVDEKEGNIYSFGLIKLSPDESFYLNLH